MDEDIRNDLKSLSKHIQDVGRFIGSNKRNAEDLKDMAEVLRMAAETLNTYVRTQKMRDKK